MKKEEQALIYSRNETEQKLRENIHKEFYDKYMGVQLSKDDFISGWDACEKETDNIISEFYDYIDDNRSDFIAITPKIQFIEKFKLFLKIKEIDNRVPTSDGEE